MERSRCNQVACGQTVLDGNLNSLLRVVGIEALARFIWTALSINEIHVEAALISRCLAYFGLLVSCFTGFGWS